MTILTVALLVIGALFTLIAAIGVVRLPDLFTRMQASTKSATLGVACMMLATLTHFADLSVGSRAVLVIGALFLTAPVAGHVIARAAHLRGVALWDGTRFDELKGHDRQAAGRDRDLTVRELPAGTGRRTA